MNLKDFFKKLKSKHNFPLLACYQDLKTGEIICSSTARIRNKEVNLSLSDLVGDILKKANKELTLEDREKEFTQTCLESKENNTTIVASPKSQEEFMMMIRVAKKYNRIVMFLPENEVMKNYMVEYYKNLKI